MVVDSIDSQVGYCVKSWELGVGSWELGVGSWELGADIKKLNKPEQVKLFMFKSIPISKILKFFDTKNVWY
ncbi:hypothetical protein BS333_15765 [Vibrio azureus]|uniref:Uncharacterized protein n=1 Tax=Vibrio azureus NBRC 104587 TaxID=1219077 RepID=U3AM26_9VIBR|nr:hypothetical protein BS333_15765 [Vibrio azureus]GAD74810.1 hypothetical protein VAZ01S_015_00540 [Vibrio azureus NBRC 104587]